jgi:hypothetical protein
MNTKGKIRHPYPQISNPQIPHGGRSPPYAIVSHSLAYGSGSFSRGSDRSRRYMI